MNGITLLTLATAISGLLIAFWLIFLPRNNSFANRFLGISFFALAYRSLAISLLQEGIIKDTFIIGSVTFVYYWASPSIYLYIRTLVNAEQSLRKKDLVHFVIPLSALLLVLFYVVRDWATSGDSPVPVQDLMWGSLDGPWQVPPIIHALVPSLCCIVYIIGVGKILIDKFFHNDEPLRPHAVKIRNWVCILFIVFVLLMMLLLIGEIIVLLRDQPVKKLFSIVILRSILLIFLFTRIVVYRKLIFGLPNIATILPKVPVEDMVQIRTNDYVSQPGLQMQFVTNPLEYSQQCPLDVNSKGPDPALTDQIHYDNYGWVRAQYLDQLLTVVAGQMPIGKDKALYYIGRINDYLIGDPFIKDDFNIPHISRELVIPVHHLEYLFRYYNKYNFPEFKNILRVQYVLRCLDQQLWKDYTIEAIGEKAGFTSRTTFFRAFKNATGKSPGAYIADI